MFKGKTPAVVYNFDVEFTGLRTVARASFANVTGVKARGNVKKVKEGGRRNPHNHVTDIEYDPIVLERGMTEDLDLAALFYGQFDPNLGLVHHANKQADGNKLTLKIRKKDRAGNVIRTVELRGCQITDYEEGDNNAMTSGILLERISVVFDEVYVDGKPFVFVYDPMNPLHAFTRSLTDRWA